MLDNYNREINYLRVSVTDRCNLRCVYCSGQADFVMKSHMDILSYEAIAEIVRVGAGLGITKVRLTGGEPLIRKNLDILVRYLKNIDGIREVVMTTNGTLLKSQARTLKNAGLDRINISLDTLEESVYEEITSGGKLGDVLDGIEETILVGFTKTKINMVVIPGVNEKEISSMKEFCAEKGLKLQLIKLFSLNEKKVAESNHGYDRPPRCSSCNKIRLLADGTIKPCLYTDKEVSIDFEDIKSSLLKAVNLKPERGDTCTERAMSQIGG